MMCCQMVKDVLYYHERYNTINVEFAINIEIVLKVNLSSMTYVLMCLLTH